MLNRPMLLSHLPSGLTVTHLAPGNYTLGKDCRRFCLLAIKDTYGYDYTPEWHRDLDSLGEGVGCQYAPTNRGAFFVLRDTDGRVVGTAGVRALSNNAGIAAMFGGRYPDAELVAFNCRLYIAATWRRRGLGRLLTMLREEAARCMGYVTVYIHCDAKAERLRRYWLGLGFRFISEASGVAHYEKPLRRSR
jgi:GNAT superfamily N-acetyltransferase